MNRVGTGAFPGGKRMGRGADVPSSSDTEFKETVELYLWPILACSRVKFTFTFTSHLLGLTLFFITNKNYTNGYFKTFDNNTEVQSDEQLFPLFSSLGSVQNALIWSRISSNLHRVRET